MSAPGDTIDPVITYGEELLRRAEARARAKAARRRRRTLLLPATAVTLWSLADLVAARHGRLSAIGVGFFRHTADHLEAVAWVVVFVIVPLLIALRPNDPQPRAAALALVAGPLLGPFLFGAGGWKLWQIAAMVAICGLILGAGRVGRRATG